MNDMGEIKAGVVVVTKFCQSTKKAFRSYINYVNRDEAIRNAKMDQFNLYNNYMDNPLKTSGLFTADKENLTDEERNVVKDLFEIAQGNGSLMWQTVISFDNDYLMEHGLYDSETGIVNERKLQDLTRGCMRTILQKEGLEESAVWSAAIHFNTDNIHIHIATVEPIPQREVIKDGKYAGQMKGTFKMDSINAGKRYIINNILDNQVENKKINEIIRNTIIGGKKNHPLIKDEDLAKKFMEIHAKLPRDKRKWQYSMNAMVNIRPDLDELTEMYIEKYHREDFEELRKMLLEQEKKYSKAYGGTTNKYVENKMDDLYKRMGNVILKEMKDYDREIKKTIYEEQKSSKGKITQTDLAIYTFVDQETERQRKASVEPDPVRNDKSVSSDLFSRVRANKQASNKKDIRFRNRASCAVIDSSLRKLKNSLNDEYQHIRNQQEYEMMRKEAERESKQELAQ